MNAAGRLGLYGAGLAAAFAVAFGAAALGAPRDAAPQSTLHEKETEMGQHDAHGSSAQGTMDHSAHAAAGESLAGVSLSAGGFTLAPVSAPGAVGEQGALSFRILDADGTPVTAYTPQHEKELHLIVVRSDGTGFRHVHPVLDTARGTWSTPWAWDAAGTYRVFADFMAAGADPVALTRTVDVAGLFTPVIPAMSTRASVDGFDVSVDGALVPGSASELTVTVRRGGAPVTMLQPYLGAYGHLVALREGDLAYLHVHPEGAALRQAQGPGEGATSGPDVRFSAQVSTEGRYLLYFDFQVEGVVRTAAFVLDTTTHAH